MIEKIILPNGIVGYRLPGPSPWFVPPEKPQLSEAEFYNTILGEPWSPSKPKPNTTDGTSPENSVTD